MFVFNKHSSDTICHSKKLDCAPVNGTQFAGYMISGRHNRPTKHQQI